MIVMGSFRSIARFSAERSGVLAQPGRSLSARREAELVQDVADMALDGVRADVEQPRDQLVAVAGRDALEHLAFARAERGVRRGAGAARHVGSRQRELDARRT